MPSLTDVYVEVKPSTSTFGRMLKAGLSKIDTAALGREAGTRFGQAVGSRIAGALGKSGLKAGKDLGTGVTRGADGQLRASTSRFTAAGGRIGDTLGKSASRRFGSAFKLPAVGGLAGLGGLKAGIAGLAVSLTGGAVVGGLKGLANAASDLNEETSKSRTIFKGSSKSIEAFAKDAAENLGMSRLEAIRGTSAFGNLFDQLGFGSQQATKMSKGFVQMATDAASFNNANPAEVMDAFLSATRGEYDALQKYIPTASAATIEAEAMRMTHKKSAADLTAAEKAAALYQVSIKGLGKAHGDFKRTGDGFANQQRILAANWADLKVKIGQFFLPSFTKAAKYMNEEGFPALTRIVGVMGRVGGSVGSMGRAVARVFSGAFGPAIDGATVNLTELADWFETHQADMVRFFVRLGEGAIGLGRSVTGFVVGSLRGFQDFSNGLADLVAKTGPAIADVVEFSAKLLPPFSDARKSALEAAEAIRTGSASAADGLRNAGTRAGEAADTLANKAYPAFDKAGRALGEVGQKEIWKAEQRDAAAAAKIAIRDIGTNADGSAVKLKTWADRTKLGSTAQRGLETRIAAARARMEEQRQVGIRAGDTQAQLTRRWELGREALYREFRQMGLSKAEAQRLTDKYAKIPKKAETKVTQPGMKGKGGAIDSTDVLDRKINDLNNKKVAIDFSTNAQKFGVVIRGSSSSASNRTRGDARGGIIPGFTPLHKGDDVAFPMANGGIQPLRGGEGITVSEVMRDPYERARLLAINKASLRGESIAKFREGRAAGGVVSRTITTATGRPPPGSGTAAAFNAIGDDIARQVGTKIGNALKKKIEAQLAATGGGGGGPIGGGGFAKGLAWARTQRGKPYRWAGVGPGGYDCSGFMSAIANVVQGRRIHARRFSTGQAGGRTVGGFTRNKSSAFRIGIVRGNPGHTAGTINGVNVESSGGVGVRVGGGARGANSGMFTMRYGLARGGTVGDRPYDLLDPRGERYMPWLRALLRGPAVGMATGGTVMRSGWARVGENGMETIYANKGDRVVPDGRQPIVINIDLGDGVTQRIEGALDERGAFNAAVARGTR